MCVYLSELSEDRHNRMKPHKRLGVVALSDSMSICRHGKRIIRILFNNVINQRKYCLIYSQVIVQWYVTVYNIDACAVWMTLLGWSRPECEPRVKWTGSLLPFPQTRPTCLVLLPGLRKVAIWRIPISERNPVQNWPWMGLQQFRIHNVTAATIKSPKGLRFFLTKTFLFTNILGTLSGISFPSHLYSSGCNLGRGFFPLAYRSTEWVKPRKFPLLT